MVKKITCIGFVVSITLLSSCGGSKSPEKNTDSISEKPQEDTVPAQVDTVAAMIKKINDFISSRTDDDNDSILWNYTWHEENGMAWDIEIHEDKNSDFCSVDLYLWREPIHVVTFHYDSNGQLCRMDDFDIEPGTWRDERTNTYYFSNGSPYWHEFSRFYKEKIVAQEAQRFTSFTQEDYPIFNDKDWVSKNICTLEPTNL